MDWEILLFVFVPPVCAMAFSFFAKSTIAKHILRWGGLWFVLNLLLSLALEFDCGFNDFSFQTCHHLPQFLADFYTLPNILNVFLYLLAAPVLLLLAGILEFMAHKGKSQP